MAKKTSKKPAKKAAKKPAKKPAAKTSPLSARKIPKFRPGKALRSGALASKPKAKAKATAAAAKKSAPKKSAKPLKHLPPIIPVTSGKGPSVMDVGAAFVAMFNAQSPDAKIWDALFNRAFTSTEGFGVNMKFEGRKAVEAKNAEWLKTHIVHGCGCDGPYCGSTGFGVTFRMDVTDTITGQRMVMEELGMYTVHDGKVVSEEFMYLM